MFVATAAKACEISAGGGRNNGLGNGLSAGA
ncbi:unnamed protein product [Ectocarpus sp. CCAP 1310/34]|nr:unnamed protein product [Ectocarpus sp. CCAP 1310/34]CAB1120953.1 unnamed protein product [Ectocarpus sp. CCAP 1310/34]